MGGSGEVDDRERIAREFYVDRESVSLEFKRWVWLGNPANTEIEEKQLERLESAVRNCRMNLRRHLRRNRTSYGWRRPEEME